METLNGSANNGTEQVKKCYDRISAFLYRHYQQIIFFGALLLFLEQEQKRRQTFKDACYASKKYLLNGCQRALQMLLELGQKITKTIVDSSHKAYVYWMYSYQWTSQKFLELTREATETVKNCWHGTTYFFYCHWQPIWLPKLRPETRKAIVTFCQKTKTNLDERCQRIIRGSLAWVEIIDKATVDSSHKAYMYMVYSYQWTSQKILVLTRKGAQKARKYCLWTKGFFYHHYQQVSFVGALLLLIKLLKKSFEVMINFFAAACNTFIANALKILTSILLLLLIVTTVMMNYQMYIERNHLQEERKVLQAERRELIAAWKDMNNEWHRSQRMRDAPRQEQDEGFIYFVKKAANIIEAAVPFTKLFW